MNAEGIGDGAGVNIDLSVKFFRKVTGLNTLEKGQFAVANFFFQKIIPITTLMPQNWLNHI